MRRVWHLANLLSLSLIVLCGITAYADTHWVNLAGSNQPPYTSYATGAHRIQDAINQMVAGDTVIIAAGVHRPDTTIFLKDSIAVIGAGRDSTVIMLGRVFFGSYYSPSTLELKGVSGGAGGGLTLKGCTVRGQKTANYGYGKGLFMSLKSTATNYVAENKFVFCEMGIDAADVSLVVADNMFDSNSTAIYLSFDGPFDIHHNTIIGRPERGGAACGSGISSLFPVLGPARIHHNTISTCQGHGISVKGVGDSVLIHNNLVMNDSTTALWAYCACDGATIQNNTIIAGAATLSQGVYLASFTAEQGHSVLVENNLFYGEGVRGEGDVVRLTGGWEPGGTVHFAYNDMWGLDSGNSGIRGVDSSSGVIVDAVGNLFRDPMFTSDTTYRLQRGSPLIDAGNPLLLDPDGSVSDIGWTGGPGGLYYEYPEEPPQKPDTLVGTLMDENFCVTWLPNTEADLSEYRLYRGSYSGFTPAPENLLATLLSETLAYLDPITGLTGDAYYVLTAVDTTGLESPKSSEVAYLYTGVFDGQELPDGDSGGACTLLVRPNPFNTTVFIEFVGLPEASPGDDVRISVYDIRGARVCALVPLYQGLRRWTAIWSGTDKSGSTVPSGMYFIKATYGKSRVVKKLCLIR